ncbi:MAG: cold shock domain-containing protein [Thiotrichaceae bacterium]|nr:cold shock domain-containing protein [Thiotrichaceae bacterium]
MKSQDLWRMVCLTLTLMICSLSCVAAAKLHQGKVKWFNPHSGFGFIKPADPDEAEQIFFHISMIEGVSKVVRKGQAVSYEVIQKNNKLEAVRVLLDPN